MPDDFSPELPPVPHADIEQVISEVQRHQENPEHAGLSGPELVKKSIQNMTGTNPLPAAPAQDDKSVLPAYAQAAPAPTQQEIEHLLGLAFREGIATASAEAAKSNPFVLDAFHDALAGKLYPELQKRGIIR